MLLTLPHQKFLGRSDRGVWGSCVSTFGLKVVEGMCLR